jgi:hypothetical protein
VTIDGGTVTVPTERALHAVSEATAALMGSEHHDTEKFLRGINALNALRSYLEGVQKLEALDE